MCYNSAWSLFTADEVIPPEVDSDMNFTHDPYAFNGKTYTNENYDTKVLDKLRTWNDRYWAKNMVLSEDTITPLDEAEQEPGDFDVMGQVVQLIHRDEYTSDIRIKDSSDETWFINILRRKFPRVSEGEFVKIRSATIDKETEREKMLKLAPYSNIMTIVPFSKAKKEGLKKINGD